MLHQLAVCRLFIFITGGDRQQSGILLDDNQIIILMDDGQSGHFLGLDLLFKIEGYGLTRLQQIVMLCNGLAVHGDLPAGQQRFNRIAPAPAELVQQERQELSRLGYGIAFDLRRSLCSGCRTRLVARFIGTGSCTRFWL
ncbi:hypothetical protein D3C80_1475320 [compost metagenome]